MTGARGAYRGMHDPHSRSTSPSGTSSLGTPNPNPKTLVLPQVSVPKPASFSTETPSRSLQFHGYAYPEDVARFRALVRKFARSGLIPSTGIDIESGKRVGGRPPVVAEAFRALLDNAEASSRRPRASRGSRGPEGIRRVDDAARVGFGRLFRAFPNRLLPFSPYVEQVVTRATGADRVQRRIEATIGFCERRLIAGFAVGQGRPTRLELILPTMVPDLYYGWGPVVYQTTLDGQGGVGA